MVVDDGSFEDLGNRTGEARLVEQLGGAVDVVGSHHNVDVAGLGTDDVTVLLGEAPGHDDLAAVALRLPRLQVAEVAVQLVVGVLADAAGVEHDHVGVDLRRRRNHPIGLEQPGDALGVVLVHLTAERAHEVATGVRHLGEAIGGSCRGPEARSLGFAPVLAILPISNGYQLFGLLHVLSVIAAFGPLFVYPSLVRAGAGAEVAKWHLRLSLPALVLAWVFGMGMVGMSDNADRDVRQLDRRLARHLGGPRRRQLVPDPPVARRTSERARSMLGAGTGITHLALVVLLWLMIFKPGTPGF